MGFAKCAINISGLDRGRQKVATFFCHGSEEPIFLPENTLPHAKTGFLFRYTSLAKRHRCDPKMIAILALCLMAICAM